MAKPKSSSLFHFTRSLENLKSVLKNGLYPRYCLEDTRYLGIPFTAYPMVCFCDIPISRIAEHTAFYGEYGIGLTREWGLKNSLTPVIYSPTTGPVPNFINYITDFTEDERKKLTDVSADLIDHAMTIFALVKPLSGRMVVGGNTVKKDFYQENEWRFVPKDFGIAFQEDLEARRDELNAAAEEHKLAFLPPDVKYIFVRSDAEVPEIFDFIQNNLGHLPLNDIKILSTRITSLETLGGDV